VKKQIGQHYMPLLWGTIAVGLTLCAAIPAFTQDATYKVGERVEAITLGVWREAEVLEIKDNGYYVLRYLPDGESFWQGSNLIRHIQAKTPTKAPVQNPNKGNAPTKVANNAAPNLAAKPQPKSIRELFGSREPHKIKDSKAPARGAITAALAKKYFIGQTEGLSGGKLYLLENVKLEVGGGVPYHPNLGAFEAINVRVPLYPIRGSYLSYQCRNLVTEYVGPRGKNANRYSNPKATGYCYKNTFGDWRCFMADPNATSPENARHNVAPPQ